MNGMYYEFTRGYFFREQKISRAALLSKHHYLLWKISSSSSHKPFVMCLDTCFIKRGPRLSLTFLEPTVRLKR